MLLLIFGLIGHLNRGSKKEKYWFISCLVCSKYVAHLFVVAVFLQQTFVAFSRNGAAFTQLQSNLSAEPPESRAFGWYVGFPSFRRPS